MATSSSILEVLLKALPQVRAQLYFKSSLTALSHAIEDQVLAGTDQPLVIASFQRERFYRQEAHRYLRIAGCTPHVYVLAGPETEFSSRTDHYEMVAFEPTDALSQEWHLIVLSEVYATCLICRERLDAMPPRLGDALLPAMDQSRRFEGLWTFDRRVACKAAELMLDRIEAYRPELKTKLKAARSQYLCGDLPNQYQVTSNPFSDRLVTYLQAGQYKLLKAYRSIMAQERKERLINSISSAIRRSLNPDEILSVAVQELGQALDVSRCFIYRCNPVDLSADVYHAYHADAVKSVSGQSWPLKDNALFQVVAQRNELAFIEDTDTDLRTKVKGVLKQLVQAWEIRACLLVPVLYQGRLLGIIELHHCGEGPHFWVESEMSLIEAIATQVGVALIQAESYAHLDSLNQQLEALDRTRSNLIAITGHELRTPLSTIQVCLESLANEPDMPIEMRHVMLTTALEDSQRMQQLVQDFLTLSHLESGRVKWHLEVMPIQECIDLAVSSIKAKLRTVALPTIHATVKRDAPLVQVDGEWVVEVLTKLLDNACKFTDSTGEIHISATVTEPMIEVIVADSGRGIEPDRLEVIFDRFYQEEGALRRTAGGTGLGLAICRQIIQGLGGIIWAESQGKDRGSQFHFTLPMAQRSPESPKTSAKKSQRT
jgi:DICT domain-containing protein/signal transduction histidine kinase